MAITTAAYLPERCAAVVSESAQSFAEDVTLSGVRAGQSAFERPEMLERLARYHGAKAQWVLAAWTKIWLGPDFADWSLDNELPRVQCPILAFHGDRDEYGSWRHPERISRLSGGPSHIVMLDGCGHVPHREQQGRVLSEVAQFLALLE